MNIQRKGKKLINSISATSNSNNRTLKAIRMLINESQDGQDEKRLVLENELLEKIRINNKEQRTEIYQHQAEAGLKLREMKQEINVLQAFAYQKQIVNPNSKYLGEFTIGKRNRVQKINYDGSWYQLLGNIPIVQRPTNEFNIIRTQRKWIVLGIIDCKYINDQNSWMGNKRQCICYDGYDGNVGISGQWTGTLGRKGIYEGETVTMKVER